MSMISEFQSGRLSVSEVILFLARPIQRVRNLYRQRKALQQLLESEDHILADLGISRDDLRYAVAYIPTKDVGDYLTKLARG
ncbi:MAG: hypothetical protein ABJN26_10570 [Stappiaceae bacterium]